MPRVPRIFLGILVAALCAAATVAVGGAGHGWMTGAVAALAEAVLAPWALVNAMRPRPSRLVAAAGLVGAAALSAFLVLGTLNEGQDYVRRAWQHAAPEVVWVVAWLPLMLLLSAFALWRRASRPLN